MIVRVPLRDETAAYLRSLAAAERRTPRQQAALMIEAALAARARRDAKAREAPEPESR